MQACTHAPTRPHTHTPTHPHTHTPTHALTFANSLSNAKTLSNSLALSIFSRTIIFLMQALILASTHPSPFFLFHSLKKLLNLDYGAAIRNSTVIKCRISIHIATLVYWITRSLRKFFLRLEAHLHWVISKGDIRWGISSGRFQNQVNHLTWLQNEIPYR